MRSCAKASKPRCYSDVDSAYATLSSDINLLQALQAPISGRGGARARHGSLFLPARRRRLLDFLNAESEYRTVELSYVNLVGSYLTAAAQLNLAVGREVIPMQKSC